MAEAFGHPADFSIAVFPVKGVMALATPQLYVFQAAADIAVIPESEIIAVQSEIRSKPVPTIPPMPCEPLSLFSPFNVIPETLQFIN